MHGSGFGGPLFWGHGLIGLLLWLLLFLVVAALVKYLFFDGRKGQ
ncbi:hypothetical protein JCM17961_29130 [Endothiovibrio diazotrophicus]